MTFLWPELLWLLLALPVLIGAYVWVLRRKKKFALRYASLDIVKEAMGAGGGARGEPRSREGSRGIGRGGAPPHSACAVPARARRDDPRHRSADRDSDPA